MDVFHILGMVACVGRLGCNDWDIYYLDGGTSRSEASEESKGKSSIICC